MRRKDQLKKEKIVNSLLKIIEDEGIHKFSFSKLAKDADISAGTPYIYFEDKIDMLTQIYVDLKKENEIGLEETIAKGETFEEKFLNVCHHYNNITKTEPKKSIFVFMIEANNIVENPEICLKIPEAIEKLFQEAIDADAVKLTNHEKLYSVLFGPRRLFLKKSIKTSKEIDNEKLDFVCKQSVKAILK